jgi:hypothetical protein
MTRLKRAFLFLMIVLLPVQSVWAGSDVDCSSSLLTPCAHESTVVSPDSPVNAPPVTHLDDSCVCHLGHVDAMLSSFGLPLAGVATPMLVKELARMTSHLSPPPERPQWA